MSTALPTFVPSARRRGLARVALACALALAAVVAWVAPASAHPSETTAVLVTVGESDVDLEIQMPVRQYNAATGAELDVYGADVVDNADELAAYALSHLVVSDADGSLDLDVESVTEETINDLPTGIITVVATAADGSVDGDVTIDYTLLIDTVATHDVYVSLVSDFANGTVTDEEPVLLGVLDWESTQLTVDRGQTSIWSGMASTVRLGIQHIASGPDHVLFLALLLVVSPLRRVGVRWTRTTLGWRASMRASARRALALVSSFTLGHTVALALVSFQVVSLPAALTEALVALSIVVAGARAIRPLIPRGDLIAALGFGLVHGTAFATTLVSLQLDPWSLAAAVVAFNVGVELAQLVVVVVLLPALTLAAQARGYSWFRYAISGVGVIAGGAWIVAALTGTASVFAPVFDMAVAHPVATLALLVATLLAVRASAGRSVDPAKETQGETQLLEAVGA